MKGKVKELLRKVSAIVISFAMILTMGTPAVFANETKPEEKSNYEIKTGSWTSRLRDHYGSVEMELHFVNYDEKDNKIFNKDLADSFAKKAKIQINDGKILKWNETGFENHKAWDGAVNYNIWSSTDRDFIKAFVKDKELNVKIWDPDGRVIKATVNNEMSEEEIKDFLKNDDEGKEPEKPEKPDTPDNPGDISEDIKYEVSDNIYMTRLTKDYSQNLQFDLSFKEREEGKTLFTAEDGDALLERGSIRINNGDLWSFKDAVLENPNYGMGKSISTFRSTNGKFIASFVASYLKSDSVDVEVILDNKIVAKGKVKNKDVDKEFIKEFIGEEPEEPNKEYTYSVENAEISKDGKKFSFIYRVSEDIPDEKKEFLAPGNLKLIIGKEKSHLDDLGFTHSFIGKDAVKYETSSKELLKTIRERKDINGKIDFYGVESEFIVNNLYYKEENSKASFYTVNTAMMHSSTGAADYPYTDPSMAGAVMEKNGEIIETADGEYKLVVYFKVAEVMGARSYATGLELNREKSPKLKEGEEGNIHTEFVAKGDDSGILIVDLPELKEEVYEGYVYSNIMSNNVALKLSNIEEAGSKKEAVENLITKVKEDTAGKTYYDKKEFDKALKAAEKDKSGENYINLLKEYSELREKLDNPFEGSDLFFVPVKASSAFANPPGTSKTLLKPWAKVVKKDGKTVITMDFEHYSDWSGKQAVSDVTVYGEDEKTPIAVDFESFDDDSAVLSFEMPYYPESGVYKAVLKDLKGKSWPTDLILDYAHIHKGMRPELIKEAIEKYDSYNLDWVGRVKGRISEDKRDRFTKETMDEFIKVLKKCEKDLEPENRKNLTQDIIDSDVKALRIARENLIFKEAEGKGKTVNKGIEGIGNPGNIYENEGPHMNEVPWAGSKVVFGNQIYKVLNNGLTYDSDKNQNVNTGNLLIMADDFKITRPWHNTEPADRTDANVMRWKDSDLRTWLNGEFYNDFSPIEKSIIKKTNLKTQDAAGEWGSVRIDPDSKAVETEDYVYLLDLEEQKSKQYGFASVESRKTMEYYFVRNLTKGNYSSEYSLLGVKPKGTIESLNQGFTTDTISYPVMNLDASKIVMTLSDSMIKDGINPVEKTEENIWNLVVKDNDVKFNVTSQSKTEVEFTASAGDIYGIVKTADGNVKAFGKVASATDGKANITVPADFKAGKDKLFLFAMEDVYGVYAASDEIEIDVTKDDVLKAAKEKKLAEINSIEISEDAKKGMTASSIKKAEEKLEALKKDAIKKVEAAKTVDAIEKIKVDKEQAEKLLNPENRTVPVRFTKGIYGDISMADKGINNKMILVEREGKLYGRLDFTSIAVGPLSGYLGWIKVEGKPAKTLKYVTDENGNPLKDMFNEDGSFFYPETVEFEIPANAQKEAADERGRTFLDCSVYVPVMDAIQEGSGTQDVTLEINWNDEDVPEIEIPEYEFLEGKNQIEEKENEARFRIDAEFSNFAGKVFVDRNLLAEKDYRAEEGSTIITLTPEYVKTLNAGKHRLTVMFKDGGVAESDFTVEEKIIDKPEVSGLSDGIYTIKGEMYKTDRKQKSMSNKALNHNLMLEIKDGRWFITADFRGMKVGQRMGYLGTMKALDNEGVLKDVEVLEKLTYDGREYPSKVRFELNDSAKKTGWQELEIFVQTMEDIAAGTGKQSVYLKLDLDSIKIGYNKEAEDFTDGKQDVNDKKGAPVTGDEIPYETAAAAGLALAALTVLVRRKKEEQ